MTNPLTLNRYGYASANPVNNVDPTGLFSLPDLGVAQAIQQTLTAYSLIESFEALANGGVEEIIEAAVWAKEISVAVLSSLLGGVRTGFVFIKEKRDSKFIKKVEFRVFIPPRNATQSNVTVAQFAVELPEGSSKKQRLFNEVRVSLAWNRKTGAWLPLLSSIKIGGGKTLAQYPKKQNLKPGKNAVAKLDLKFRVNLPSVASHATGGVNSAKNVFSLGLESTIWRAKFQVQLLPDPLGIEVF
jgi:hypothetical protein